MFSVFGQAELASAATYEILFVTPNTTKWPHMHFQIRSTGEAHYDLYKDATTTNVGTPCASHNRNHNSAATPSCLCYHSPILSDDGTLKMAEHFGSGKIVGGQSRDTHEIILAQNSTYLLRITSEAAANDISWILNWYEHTNAA